MAWSDIFSRKSKPLDQAEADGVSPIGELGANDAVRKRQRLLLCGVAGVGLIAASFWIFSDDKKADKADDGTTTVEVSTKDMVIGGFSFDGMMHQLNNLARRYVAADLARIDSFKITILAAHTLFFAGVAFFRRHLLFPARPVRSLDHG